MIEITHSGRMGNCLLQDIGASIISKNYNLQVINYNNNYENLTPNFYRNGRIIESNKITVDCNDNEYIIDKIEKIKNNFNNNFSLNLKYTFQSKTFILPHIHEIKDHFNFLKYNKTFENSVFIHVRLGDVKHKNPGFEYYDYCLENMYYDHGFLSSDSPEHPIVKKLCKKFKLNFYDNSPNETILFAKNFGNLVLSAGTFSWWIAFLSKANHIIYPKDYITWGPDIFYFNGWNGI